MPAEHFSLALEVLADQLLNSTFLPDAFERERRVVFEELKQRNDAAGTRAFDEFVRLVFRVSPLRRDAGGTIERAGHPHPGHPGPPRPPVPHREYGHRRHRPLRHVDAVEQIERRWRGCHEAPGRSVPRSRAGAAGDARLDLGDGTGLAECASAGPPRATPARTRRR